MGKTAALFESIGMDLRFSLSFKFIAGCCLTLLVSLGAVFYVVTQRQEKLIIRQAENEARAIFRQVVLMRRWIADHGGVFVEKLPSSAPSPYLKTPEILDRQGKSYARKTPAMVTKELARYSREEGLFWFHITSLRLTNPENKADEFERRALIAFEQAKALEAIPPPPPHGRRSQRSIRESSQEFIAIENIDGHPYLRYISPLFVEEACLQCHQQQGYKLGDVRGAISVSLPMDKTFAEAARNRRWMFASMLMVVGALSGAMIMMLRFLVLEPMQRLSCFIKDFSQGDYQPDTLLPTGDEFDELSRAFTEMAEKLTGYYDDLEERINEATRDLAESNRLLAAASERKSDFIARASHELRTPLTSIKGSMEYVTARLARLSPGTTGECPREELTEFFQLISKNNDRLIGMVNTMLDLERIEAGSISALHLAPCDLNRLIRENAAGLAGLAGQKQVGIETELAPELVLEADEERLRQVLTNLLANAIKFAPQNSAIIIKAYRDGDEAVVEVRDQGPGIPEGEREKIFDKFYKLGNKEGSGLGLAICRSIITAHGGRIGVGESQTGACLYFRLPIGVAAGGQKG